MAKIESEIRRIDDGRFVTGHVNRVGTFVDVRPCDVRGPEPFGQDQAVFHVIPSKGQGRYITLTTGEFAGDDVEIPDGDGFGVVYHVDPLFEFAGERFVVEGSVRAGYTESEAERAQKYYAARRAAQIEEAGKVLGEIANLVKGDTLTRIERRWLRRWAIDPRKAGEQARHLLNERFSSFRDFVSLKGYDAAHEAARATIRAAMVIEEAK